MVPSAMILVNFGNAFCPFFYRSEIVAAHKIMDIRPLAAWGLPGSQFAWRVAGRHGTKHRLD
jgi:hypothetical protein